MTSYRITKYNPEKRHEKGYYLDQKEWTGISDIGRPENNYLTYEEYEITESAYVEAIKYILNESNFDSLRISSIENRNTKGKYKKYSNSYNLRNINVDFENEINKLKNGQELRAMQLEKIIRLILREVIWMVLSNDEIEIRFGYDYYMYVKHRKLNLATITKIEQLGLFVEPNVAPIEYSIIDKNGNEV